MGNMMIKKNIHELLSIRLSLVFSDKPIGGVWKPLPFGKFNITMENEHLQDDFSIENCVWKVMLVYQRVKLMNILGL